MRWEDERSWPLVVWTPPTSVPAHAGWRCVSTGIVGGGIGPICWWVDAMVSREYFHPDPVAHVSQIAADFDLAGPGVGMLTAADVTMWRRAQVGGVDAVATVGLGLPVWAAAAPEAVAAERDVRVGTINVLVALPVPLSDAALVNAVVTATEAKTQALLEAGVPGTGTSSDAVCVACPVAGPGLADPQEYGGPRSPWGQQVARAVHGAVAAGTAQWLLRNGH